jgi:hypothetical protein
MLSTAVARQLRSPSGKGGRKPTSSLCNLQGAVIICRVVQKHSMRMDFEPDLDLERTINHGVIGARNRGVDHTLRDVSGEVVAFCVEWK